MRAFNSWDTRQRDRCACGRMKDVWDYCCDPCYAEHHKVRTRDSRVMRDKAVRVVFCPDNELQPGAMFDGAEFGLAVKSTASHWFEGALTNGYWPTGMVVEYKGKLYQVEGEGGQQQSVRELEV
jgi:hypothetical protein